MNVTRTDPARSRYADAPQAADHTIDQQWEAYSPAEHGRWDRLFARSREVLEGRACAPFLDAVAKLRLSSGGIPHMRRLSDRLERMTGWRVVAVRGLVPDEVFFDHLANRRFPAGAFIRSEAEMDYIEEPDVFHDIFGHVPLLADPTYAAYLEAYGRAGARAMARGRLKNLARLYWYTVEFGLIEEAGALRLFGAGIMSSTAESMFALEDPSPHRVRFDLGRVMRTDYIIDDFQQVYFVIDSFEALLAECERDFGPLYDRLAEAAAIPPDRLIDSDCVLHRGTLDYFRKT
ncbi:phenylalanine 4-monooxygenase [Rhodobacteraceae bacterium 2CG4]|uniref:Phenylalanine-4-hydroxylase n=1 Tax=Halovulum marinum TaxID=2662447 RepID=A0A6L5Z5A2_9RHOB|nr:phenylalanine 4-monooxygenase [Halovulum marinum]MSU91290.1 phenylalanine 4-monooxygenase [Halovulum marinum]